MKISLIIPAYNEEKRLAPFLASVAQYARNHRQHFKEIIVVDDGSTDNTVKIAAKYSRQIPFLKIIKMPNNKGKGAAVKAGVDSAKGEAVIFMDADGATPIGELPKMIHALTQADIGVGNRWMPGSQTERGSRLRKLSGWIYRNYMKLFGLGKIDTMCGFKGYRTPVARKLFKNLLEERWLFDTEIAYKSIQAKYRILNFPIRWTSKDGSKLDTKTLLRSAWEIRPLIKRLNT